LANLAAQQNAFTLAFVAMPFHLEGKRKREQAEEALSVLRSLCHGVVVVPNDLLLQQLDSHATALQAFELANEWIQRALRAIFKVLFARGYIQLSPQTLQQVLSHKGGKTLFALGQGKGENYVQAALQDLVLCPLLYTLEQSRKADHIALHMVAGSDLPLSGINAILSFVSEHFHALGKTCLGVFLDPSERQSLELCVLGSVDTEASGPHLTLDRAGVGLQGGDREAFSEAAAGPDLIERAFVSSKPEVKDSGCPVAQAEFTFVSQGHVRGFFDTSDKNAFQGEDLDVPTYLRRGIKLSL
jgi:cell division protein FtsZ